MIDLFYIVEVMALTMYFLVFFMALAGDEDNISSFASIKALLMACSRSRMTNTLI